MVEGREGVPGLAAGLAWTQVGGKVGGGGEQWWCSSGGVLVKVMVMSQVVKVEEMLIMQVMMVEATSMPARATEGKLKLTGQVGAGGVGHGEIVKWLNGEIVKWSNGQMVK